MILINDQLMILIKYIYIYLGNKYYSTKFLSNFLIIFNK